MKPRQLPRLRATLLIATICAFSALLGPGLAGASSAAPQIDAGPFQACAFYPADGNVNCWGLFPYAASPPAPTPLGWYGERADYLAGDATDFAVGDWSACVLHPTGNTSCWGEVAASMEYHGGDAIKIAVGGGASCVLTTAHNVNCTGYYFGGENTWQPTYTGGDAEWVVMSSYAGCIKTVGSNVLNCFGWNVNEPSWVTNGTPTPAAGGHYAMCMLMAEGNVDCMSNSYNEYGQTQPPASITTAVDVDAHFDRSCAALANGDVTCWGRNYPAGGTATNQVWSYPGVGATSVAVANQDVCWTTASGTTGCASSTPDSYISPTPTPTTLPHTLSVPATGFPGVDSGVLLAAGQTVSVTATGTWAVGGPYGSYGGNGATTFGTESCALTTAAPMGALVGSLNGGASWFAIGASGTVTGPGELLLLANDCRDGGGGGAYFGDNSGALSVTIATYSAPVDTTPPTITTPASITGVPATSPAGAVVTYSASGTDAVSGAVAVTCVPASGSTFALGTTTVTCSASDAAGNSASSSFTVEVVDATAPTVLASLVRVKNGGDDESTQTFRVVFSATDASGVSGITASLNGIAVTNGQLVKLKTVKKGPQKSKREDGKLQIEAVSFLLTVAARDAAGNVGTATAAPVFARNGKDDDRKDDRKGDRD